MSRVAFGLLMNGMFLSLITVGAAMVWIWGSTFGTTKEAKKITRTAGWIALATIPLHAFIIWSVETWAK